MARIHSAPSPTGSVLAGTLDKAIIGHATERMRHFFLYLYIHRIIIERLNTAHGQTLAPDFGMRVAATHQVDSGMRSTDAAYYGFDNTDPNIIQQPATACGRMDAAHYCNLGVAPALGVHCNTVNTDRPLFDLFEALKLVCGNTRYMPQRINIGPDRVIDQMHGDLARDMLDGTPPIDSDHRRRYVTEATQRLNTYRQGQHASGNHGVVACVDVYLQFYGDAALVDDVWATVKGNAWGECTALGIPASTVVAANA